MQFLQVRMRLSIPHADLQRRKCVWRVAYQNQEEEEERVSNHSLFCYEDLDVIRLI